MKFRFKRWTLVAALIAGASAGVPASAFAHPAAFAAIHAARGLGGMHGMGAIHGIGAIHGFGGMHAGFGGMHANWGDHGWGHGGWGHSRWNHNWNGNWNFNRNVNINRNVNRNIHVNRNVNANWNRNWGHHWRSGRFARSHHRWRDGFGRWHWFADTAAIAAALSYAGADYGGSYEDESSYGDPATGYSGDYDVQNGDGCCACEEDDNMYGDGQDCGD
jgi:hypothetical protein